MIKINTVLDTFVENSPFMQKIVNYLSLVKFSHTIFAMPFAMIGFFYGIRTMTEPVTFLFLSTKLIIMILCLISARNAAMSFNRYIDRNIDKENPRTAEREIPSGVISKKNARRFIIINVILFFITAASLNTMSFVLSPIALIIIFGYSLTKRFTWLCHTFLGLALSIAPIGAYIAVAGNTAAFNPTFVGIIAIIVITWVSGFDILYSLQDEDFDRDHNLFSIPVLLGRKRAIIMSFLLHIVTISLLIFLGIYFYLNIYYWIGAILFSFILVYEHTVVSADDISRVNLAFAVLNGIGSVIFAAFTNFSFI
ncbi:MAG: UbiA-like polyprenyltransferase [Rikenellaceae bacterium]